MSLPAPLARLWPDKAEFEAGFKAVMPLWLGLAPFAVAYAFTAQAGGLSALQTQMMSLTLFAGAAQFAAAGLFSQHAAPLAIVLTVGVLNVRHLLYGLSLSQKMPLTPAQRAISAQFLTDEAYGMSVTSPRLSYSYLLGAEMSVYVPWNLFTLLGVVGGSLVKMPDPEALGIGIVLPLAFLGLLIPQLSSRLPVAVALFSGALAWLLSRWLHGGPLVLVVAVIGAALGAWLHTRAQPTQEEA